MTVKKVFNSIFHNFKNLLEGTSFKNAYCIRIPPSRLGGITQEFGHLYQIRTRMHTSVCVYAVLISGTPIKTIDRIDIGKRINSLFDSEVLCGMVPGPLSFLPPNKWRQKQDERLSKTYKRSNVYSITINSNHLDAVKEVLSAFGEVEVFYHSNTRFAGVVVISEEELSVSTRLDIGNRMKPYLENPTYMGYFPRVCYVKNFFSSVSIGEIKENLDGISNVLPLVVYGPNSTGVFNKKMPHKTYDYHTNIEYKGTEKHDLNRALGDGIMFIYVLDGRILYDVQLNGPRREYISVVGRTLADLCLKLTNVKLEYVYIPYETSFEEADSCIKEGTWEPLTDQDKTSIQNVDNTIISFKHTNGQWHMNYTELEEDSESDTESDTDGDAEDDGGSSSENDTENDADEDEQNLADVVKIRNN